MSTFKDLANLTGLQPDSLKKKAIRWDLGTFGVNDQLPQMVVDAIIQDKKPDPAGGHHAKNGTEKTKPAPRPRPDQPAPPDPKPEPPEETKPAPPAPDENKPPKPEPPPKEADGDLTNQGIIYGGLESVLPVLPLPMLGLAASYGVYFFSRQFVPGWVAISEAAAFELTYIGLSVLRGLSPNDRHRADQVARGAVFVSVIYNSLAAAIHQQPDLLKDLAIYWFWIVSTVQGAPLAILAYLVADLLFHRK